MKHATSSRGVHREEGDNGAKGTGKMRFALTAALITLSLIACRPTFTGSAPRFVVTAAPIDVGISGRGLCIAVDPNDSTGVWWWQPGHSGCSSRSTGPGVFRADDARVTVRARPAPPRS